LPKNLSTSGNGSDARDCQLWCCIAVGKVAHIILGAWLYSLGEGGKCEL